MYAGIDVGSRMIHLVVLAEDGRPVEVAPHPPGAIPALARWLAREARVVAVDAPDALSTAPHHDDASLSRKFRDARCAEIALGREGGIWVPWATPTDGNVAPEWMRIGFDLFTCLRDAGIEAIEVYPYAGFRRLAGGTLPKKKTAEGAQARARLLHAAGVTGAYMDAWAHDFLDAALAALVALRSARGAAAAVTCGHDGSAIWVP